MFKKFYTFLNFRPNNLEGRVADTTLRAIFALFDLIIAVLVVITAVYIAVGLAICVYHAIGRPQELAEAVAVLAQFFPQA